MSRTRPSVETLLAAAAELSDPSTRASYLDQACAGEAGLRREVESLLAAHDKAGAFLQQPAPGAPLGDPPAGGPQLMPSGGTAPASSEGAALSPLAEKEGDRIGRYKLLEKIGTGGFGDVWMAGQEEPVRRRVALKVIRLGMDTSEVVARFEAERQALALMDHPNIARVFDGGATEQGRPYFVMELVRGIPITTYCDETRLSTRERLELFVRICQAVQHAHQKGIIHRDLKPSNILVTLHDGVPVPKVIDFGIAKATAQRLTDKTLFTAFTQLIGTPAYMSPEQAEMSGLDIDTRSDIYSLGVLLYKLLTGKTPFDTEQLLAAGLDSMRRTIREKEPARPSTRLSTMLKGELVSTAAHRRTEASKLINAVRGDLDWIVMKCLEKDRTRRYETANGLARDIERHMNHEPVVARPPSVAYRFNRFVRRHRVGAATALLIGATLVAATIVSVRLAIIAEQARQTASDERQKSDAAHHAEAVQRRRAETNAVESLDRLVRLNVASGNRMLDEGDYLGSLAWFAEALELDRTRPDKLTAHRLRILTVITESPKLLQMWFHGGPVKSAAFSKDGQYAVTASEDQTARVWDVHTGLPVTPPLRHAAAVLRASFSPDGRQVLTAGYDKARLWNASSGAQELAFDHEWVQDAIFSPDGRLVATASARGTVRLWNARSGRPTTPVLLHTARPLTGQNPGHLAFSPDGRQLVTASYDNTAAVWDVPTGARLHTLQHSNVVRHADFSPDGALIATAHWGNTAHIWNAATGQPVGPPLPHEGMVDHVTFSPDGNWLVSSSAGGTVKIWEARTGHPIRTIAEGKSLVMQSVFSPAGDQLLTRTFEGRVRAWSTRDGSPATCPLGHGWWVTAAQYHPDGRRLLTACADGSVRLWDLKPDGLLASPWPHRPPPVLGWSDKGTELVTVSGSKLVEVWDANKWQPNALGLSLTNRVLKALFSGDQQRLLTVEQGPEPAGTNSGRIELKCWHLPSGRILHSASVPVGEWDWLPDVFWANPDGTQLVFASDRVATAWDLRANKLLWRSRPHATKIRFFASSPQGRYVAFNCERFLHVAEAITGRIAYSLTNNLHVSSAAFSQDGRLVVTTSSDDSYGNGYARIWETATGRLLRELEHKDGVLCAAFSADGRLLATGGEAKVARVFDVNTGQPVTPHLTHEGRISALAFSPDGQTLATGSHDKTARLWDLATGEPITPPLNHSNRIAQVLFLAGGQYLATRSGDSFYVWNLQPGQHAIEDLLGFARLLAGHRVDSTGVMGALSLTQLSDTWQQLRRKLPDSFRFNLQNESPILELAVARDKASARSRSQDGAGQPLDSVSRRIDSLVRQAMTLSEQRQYEEAEPLLRQAMEAARAAAPVRGLTVSDIAYRLAEVLYRQAKYSEAEPLSRQAVLQGRTRLPPDNDYLLMYTATLARLLTDWAWADRANKAEASKRAYEAERLLRDCLEVRAKAQRTSNWRVADVRSRLGAALVAIAMTDSALSQQARLARMREAEQLVLESERALQQDPMPDAKYKRDAVERVVRLYEAWDFLAPDTGKHGKVSEWRRKAAELDKVAAAEEPE